MEKRPDRTLAAFAVCLLVAGSSAWAITITNADISAGKYAYDLTRAETLNGTFWADISYSTPSAFVAEDAWGATYVRSETGCKGAAYFEFRFDFSASNYRPTYIDVLDNIALFRNNNSVEDARITTAISFDGVHFQTIQSHETTDFSGLGMGWTGHLVENVPGLPAVVYYRATFTSYNSNGFGWLQEQWNRFDDNNPLDPNHFTVQFGVTTIPEPISMIFFGTGLVAVGGFVARRRAAKKE